MQFSVKSINSLIFSTAGPQRRAKCPVGTEVVRNMRTRSVATCITRPWPYPDCPCNCSLRKFPSYSCVYEISLPQDSPALATGPSAASLRMYLLHFFPNFHPYFSVLFKICFSSNFFLFLNIHIFQIF